MTAPQLADEHSPTSTPPPAPRPSDQPSGPRSADLPSAPRSSELPADLPPSAPHSSDESWGPPSFDTAEDAESHVGRGPVLVAVLIAAVIGAAALPGHAYGIGWPICAIAVFGAVLTARWFRSTTSSTSATGAASPDAVVAHASAGDRAWRISAGVAALALTAVPAIRASETLAVLCIITAVLLASYSLAGGRTWLGLASGASALVPAAIRSLGWSAKEVTVETASRRVGRITLGIAVGIVLFLIFGTLLAKADPVFADLIDSWLGWLSDVDGWRLVRGLIVIGWLALAAAYQVHRRRSAQAGHTGREPRHRSRSLAAAEWVIPLVLLDALFAVFVLVQLTVLFGGHDYVLGAGGPDYAVYARGGSGQLGLVTALTLGVVAALAAWARRSSTLDLGLIRTLGGILCGLTLVIVASALKRLDLYADAYGFTWPRMLGFAGEAWLGLIFVLVLVAGIRLRASWLPRATVAAAVGVLFALAAVNPEAVMARGVLARYDGPYGVDYYYVQDLSADSVPELQRLPAGRIRDCELNIWVYRLKDRDPWYELNLARENARAIVGTKERCGYPG